MACSKYEYVKKFEETHILLPSTYIVIRIDGKGFHKFTTLHNYEKPNDKLGLTLMNICAEEVMKKFTEIWISYGQSDEFSFVLRKNTVFFNRRSVKIVSCIVSCFTSAFVFNFPKIFKEKELKELPMFDGRCVMYPSSKILRDYLNWRQVDCHINNLYNTCFWNIVKSGVSEVDAEKTLRALKAEEKNELLFSKFGINYNNEDAMFKKGSILIRLQCDKEKNKLDLTKEEENKEDNEKNDNNKKKENKNKSTSSIVVLHEDLIKDSFWEKYKESLFLEDN